jgi:hemerythrin
MEKKLYVEWNKQYVLGIPLIDKQHQKLFDITNMLYNGCLAGDDMARRFFLNSIHEAVDYVRYHFATEEKLFAQVGYPNAKAHKKEHEAFVMEILQQVQSFKDGKHFVPNNFVRYLKDWVQTHIAVSDKAYTDYLISLKKRGLLSQALKAKAPGENKYDVTDPRFWGAGEDSPKNP